MTVRVLVVDDQEPIRDGIASLLGVQPGIEVVGVAGDGRTAVELAPRVTPDVVLMDVRMPVMDGVAAAAELAPTCKVVMLSTFDDHDHVVRAPRVGAVGYLLKDLPVREVAEAVRLAHAGATQLDPAVARALAAPRPLTAREVDVLRQIAAGATNREIAARLHLDEGTVKNHVSRILSRLGLRDRTQLALYAREL